MFRRAATSRTLCVASVSTRTGSSSRVETAQYADPWPAPGQAPERPSTRSQHPQLKLRKTSVEWRLHHGNGVRHGHLGPLREIADFEYEDGTPSSINRKRFAFKHFQDGLLVQLIRAGAVVERAAANQYLPRIPGVPEQRDWDPEIPLFLEDADEHGKAPSWHYQQKSSDNTAMNRATHNHIDAKYQKASSANGSPTLVNKHQQETLEPITTFASYDPSAFVSEPIALRERTKPTWSRRRWALSDEFMVAKSPQPKNTIKDE
jgi:hypothetical protein